MLMTIFPYMMTEAFTLMNKSRGVKGEHVFPSLMANLKQLFLLLSEMCFIRLRDNNCVLSFVFLHRRNAITILGRITKQFELLRK